MCRSVTSQRVSGSTCTERKVSRSGSAEGWRVNGLEVHAGMPRSERSRISGCDSRNAAKSGSSLLGGAPTPPFSVYATRKNKTEWGRAPDGRRKGPQLEGGVPREYPRERAMSVLMDGHLHVQHAQTRQQAQHFGYEQFECGQHSVLGKVDFERFDEFAPCRGGIYERQKKTHGALGGKITDVAIQYSLGDGIEALIDEEQGMEVKGPGKKR